MSPDYTACPKCGELDFELRIKKDEGVAAAKCAGCANDYLLLDSDDYWFDCIQQGYPRLSHCSCKGTTFKLNFEYGYRENGDVKFVAAWSCCSSCGKAKRQFTADIDYSPTDRLVSQPLIYCTNPKILYDLVHLSLYATKEDLSRFAAHLADTLNCQFAACANHEQRFVHRRLRSEEVKDAITSEAPYRRCRYRTIYASLDPLALPETEFQELRDENIFWKRNEVIRISSPTHILIGSETGLLYYIDFSNDYVADEQVIAKSQWFRELTSQVLAWLNSELVSWRGRHCFDNPAEHLRLFGDRFRMKA